MIRIELQKQLKSANGKMLLEADFSIKKGEFVALYGASGAGKTSILRMIAGLLKPQKGKIVVNGSIWLDLNKRINLSPQARQVGMLFQDYALFPNMTVEENLLFALPKNGNRKAVEDVIEIIELEGLKTQKTQFLSKGQQQRVALARALIQRPKLLLLDEPLSALDDKMRLKLQDYLLKVHELYDLTTILISHDVGEILKMADKVFQIKNGQITGSGSPKDIFSGQTNRMNISGIIQKIEIKGNQLQILVNWNNEYIQILVSKEDNFLLKIGDKIELTTYMVGLTIIKN
ncbi:MAG: sulfate/molybdate ABC transporter ATP-binding protein [Saprospiraceae bacterium]